jgi:hypothetical protein
MALEMLCWATTRRRRKPNPRESLTGTRKAESDYDSINQIRGLDVAITTTATNDVEARSLLDALGFPFAADGGNRSWPRSRCG